MVGGVNESLLEVIVPLPAVVEHRLNLPLRIEFFAHREVPQEVSVRLIYGFSREFHPSGLYPNKAMASVVGIENGIGEGEPSKNASVRHDYSVKRSEEPERLIELNRRPSTG